MQQINKKLTTHLQIQPLLHPNVPQNVTGVKKSNGDIEISYDNDPNALAHLIHYGDANSKDEHTFIYMGYSETNKFTLKAADIPVGAVAGDKIPFCVQAFDRVGVGATDIEKAAYLNDNDHITGSAWSQPVEVTI